MYVLWQHFTYYDGATKNYYHTLQNQARLCGRNLESNLSAFEADFKYSVARFDSENLLQLPVKRAQSELNSAFGRFYSGYQNMISGIFFTDGNSTLLYHRTKANYFNLDRSDKMFDGISEVGSGFMEEENQFYYHESFVAKNGNRPFQIIVKLDLTGMAREEFQKFYIGSNSFMYLTGASGIDYIFYSEKHVSSNSVNIDSINTIYNSIYQGYEGKLDHSISINDEKMDVISAYYPFVIADNNFGIVFSIDKSTFLKEVNFAFLKVTLSFIVIIMLIVYLFRYIIKQRDKAHQEYIESEQRQSGIVKSFPDTLLIQDQDGTITEIYNNDDSIFENTGKIYLSRPLNETFEYKSTYNQYRTIFNNFKERNKLAVGEIKCGDSSFYEVRVSPYGDGKSVTIFRDISTIKLVEMNLKLSHERFLTVINSIDAIIYVADMHSNEILLINNYGKDKFGDVVGKKCFNSIWYNNDSVCLNCINSKLINNDGYPEQNLTREYFDSKSEEWYKLHDRAIQWYDGRVVKLQISYNITENKNIIQQLKESEEKFRSIYESLLDVHFRTDIGGAILMISPSVKKLIDFTPDEITGKNATMLYSDSNDRNKFVSRLLQEGAISDFEVLFQKRNGEKIAVSLNSKIVYNSKNHPLWIEGTIRDVSERNKTVRELREAKIAAEAADKTKSQFLASMSHELRTPLNGILGYTQILLQDRALNTNQLEGINVIHKSGEHLLKLINDILDLSKIDADKVQLEFAPFNLKELVENIYSIVLLKAESKKLKLEINFGKVIPERIIQDEKRMQQVLLNLLYNAVKFTEVGKITLDINYKENFLKFDVIDSGIGIPEDKQSIIFSPFEQLGDHLRKSEGTGLGLAISSKLVKLLGGHLTLESEPGVGSTFSFEIPVEIDFRNDVNDKPAYKEEASFCGNNKKILIADDNDLNRLVIGKMLQKKGLTTIEAIDGIDAYNKAREQQPDLILMDKFMPNMDGIESTKKIKSEMKIPIILISATKFDAEDDQVKDAAFEATILKPVKREVLFEIVSQFLGKEEFSDTRKTEIIEEKIPENYDLELLIEFIEKRKISRFFQYLDHLNKKDTSFEPFINKMKQMASGFQMAEIKSILEQNKEKINE